MSYNSNTTSAISSNHSYTTFGGTDDIPYTGDLTTNQIQNYASPQKSRSVRFASVEHINKAEVAGKAGYSVVEVKKRDNRTGEQVTPYDETITLIHPEQKPPLKFKLDDRARKKLRERAPIISGHTLEHYYRYGKPPFLNYGYLRNRRLTRY